MADQASDKSPEATIDAAPGGRAGWTAVTVFLILYAVAYLDRQVITLLVDPIREDLGISDFQISILQGSAFVLFFTTFGLPIGWAVDRVKNRRRIVFIGIVIWSLAAAAGGLARTYWQLMLSRFGVGAGEASLAPTAYSMLSDLFPKDRLAGAMAVYSTGAIVGGAISLMLGGLVVALASASSSYSLPLVGELSPWQLVFMITGLPGLGLAFLVFLIAEPRRRGRIKDAEAAGASMPSLLPYLKSRAGFYAAHMFGFSFLGLMAAGYANWVPTFLMRKFEMPVANVGFTLGGLNLIGGVGGMLGGAYLVDYLFRRGMRDAHLRFYMWLALACCGFGLGAMLSPSLEVALACMFGVKAVTPFIAVAAASLQITTPNEYRGRVSALFLFIYNIIAYGAGPSIMAGISDFAIGGDGDLGLAIAITFGIFGPLAAITLGLGMKPMRRAVRLSEAWSGA